MMNSFFIKKVLPVLSGLLLLASLFFFFKRNENKAEIILKKELASNYEIINRITNQSNLISYEKMEKMTRKRPDDNSLSEVINEVIQISQRAKATLQDIFKNPSKEQNNKINQAVHDYQTSIYALLDSVEKTLPIVTVDDIRHLKLILHCDTVAPFSVITEFQKSILMNRINTNSFSLISHFSSRIGTLSVTYDRFRLVVSLSAVTQNTQTFKIYLNNTSVLSNTKNLEIYSEIHSNKESIKWDNYQGKTQIPIKDNSTQTITLSTNWKNLIYSNLNLPSTISISDTFTLTPFN